MIIKSIEINNYKSLGDSRNLIYLEKGVTSLIGKNESGKSNIIEAIGSLPFKNFIKANDTYYKNQNINNSDEVSVNIVLTSEKENYPETILRFYSIKQIQIEGGLSRHLESLKGLNESANYILSINKVNQNWRIQSNNANESQRLQFIYEYLENRHTMFLPNYYKHLELLQSKIIPSHNDFDTINSHIENIKNNLDEVYENIPTIFYRQELEGLKSSYTYEEIEEIINKADNNILNKFIK